jgi:hypothetical protein
MPDGPPTLIAINHDDYKAEHVGRLSDGRQFFLTRPFVPPVGGRASNEFVALFLFDAAGKLVEAKIDELGPRSTMDQEKARVAYDQRLRDLGEVSFERIEIAPFSIERFGTTFGLIARPPDEHRNSWCVELHPGNYLAFNEPWDRGDYDT